MSWVQRPAGTKFPDSQERDYHGCLDALIRTLRSMRITVDVAKPHITNPALLMIMEWDIREAQQRADICAGMLFDRWVEELP